MNPNHKLKSRMIMALVLATALSASSCSKYEEGPVFSLKSKTKRLASDWDLEELKGELPLLKALSTMDEGLEYQSEVTLLDYDIEFEFQEDGDFELDAYYAFRFTLDLGGDWGPITSELIREVQLDGEWEFSSDKEEIDIDFERNDYDYGGIFKERTYKIIKLATDELILETEDGDELTFDN